MRQHVAILGAGWAGLSAALALTRRGIRVTVFEASRQLGGRARRVSLDGQHLDNGQHILIGAYRDCLELLHECGMEEQTSLLRLPLELRYADGFHLKAPRLPAPLHLGVALARTRGLSWTERLAAARFMAALRKLQFRIAPEVTVDALLVSYRQYHRVCRYLWHPLCISALNTPPERASAAAFAAVLRDSLAGQRADSDLLIPRVDLGTLFADPVSRCIEERGGLVRLGAPVRTIREDKGQFSVDASTETYTHLVIATAPQHAHMLLEDERLAVARKTIEALNYQPIVTCYLQYPGELALPCPMLGFASGTVQWLFDRGQLGGPRGLLAAVISAEGVHRELDQAELARRVHEDIAAGLKPLTSTPLGVTPLSWPLPLPLWTRVITEKRATFSCDAGVQRPAGLTPIKGLLLAGDYVASEYPGTLEAAVRSGLAAAAAIEQA